MHKLPQKILATIVDQLAKHKRSLEWRMQNANSRTSQMTDPNLAYYATISHAWKDAVERNTFAEISVASHALDGFQATVTGKRRSFVKSLKYQIHLVEHPPELGDQCKAEGIHRHHDKRYTDALMKLFSILYTWETAYGVQTVLRLVISPHNDFVKHTGMAELPLPIGPDKQSVNRKVVELAQPLQFPIVNNVQELEIIGAGDRMLSPIVATDIIKVLPNLKHIHWESRDIGDSDTRGRSELRQVFAERLQQVKPKHGSSAKIYFWDDEFLHGEPRQVNLVPAGWSYDPLSAALRRFSENLTTLDICACVDSSIFWPYPQERRSSIPHWPFLRILKTGFSVVSPTGGFHFGGPSKAAPDALTVTPIVEAPAKAVREMPLLEHFAVRFGQGWHGRVLEITYYAPTKVAAMHDEAGNVVRDDEVDFDTEKVCVHSITNSRRIYYRIKVDWNQGEVIRAGLKSMGWDKSGWEVVERFTTRVNWPC